MDARRREGHLMCFSSPHANLVIAGKAVRLLEFVLPRGEGGIREAPADGRGGNVVVERLVYPTRSVGLKPRRDPMSMHAK
jgi:hypothetical protein